MRVFSFLAACTFLFLAGCDFGNPICPAVAEPAVIVEVRNAVTDDPEAENADGVLIDGEYTDSLRVNEETDEGILIALAGGFERAGTYTVCVEKPRFQTWTREDVDVDDGECGPETERLTARMEPIE
ncbi:MAG: hypothetical protein BRD42_06890 [Bacteroidetes bacterium QS_3_64_15]|nr:MAG: hypothetical protein BRD42_06890 [Bacteroidetes bacterium QS_3_64_15]